MTLASKKLPSYFDSDVLEGPASGAGRVEGEIPSWLHGRLVRTAPAIFEYGSWKAQHWFDAVGMLYKFEISADGQVTWMQRLLESDFTRSVLSGHVTQSGFGTAPSRSLLSRVLHPGSGPGDNTNVNIIRISDRWIAMTETVRQLSIDPVTLKTIEELKPNDSLPGGVLTLAHPHFDFERREVISTWLVVGPKNLLIVYKQDPRTLVRQEIGRIPLSRVAYIHSFSITRSKIVVILHPYHFNPIRMIGSSKPISEHYRWSPQLGTEIVVMDRDTGSLEHHRGEAFFVFHTANAYEEKDGSILLDVLAYPDAQLIQHKLKTSELESHGLPKLAPVLKRLQLKKGGGEFQFKPLPVAAFDFPVIHYSKNNGKNYRFVWGSDLTQIVKVDLESEQVHTFKGEGVTYGEPVFVGRPGASAEDDGVLLSVGSGKESGRSELLVLDAQSLAKLACVVVPISIPLGYHGNFSFTM